MNFLHDADRYFAVGFKKMNAFDEGAALNVPGTGRFGA